MSEKTPHTYAQLNVLERRAFEEKCEEIANALWSGKPLEEILKRAQTLFPTTSRDYAQSLIGSSSDHQAKFVFKHLRTTLQSELSDSDITYEKFLPLYIAKRSYVAE